MAISTLPTVYSPSDTPEVEADQIQRVETPDGQVTRYQYDTIGNRQQATEWENAVKTTVYTANALNQYPSITIGSQPPVDLQYDPDGNLTNDGIFQYEYDAENRLITVTPLDPASGLQKVTLVYDYQHRRSQRQVYEWQTDD